MWKDTIKNRRQAEEYMEKLRAGGIVLGLDSMRRLAAAMGNPQDELRFVHIAGTNGKGSLLAFLSRILWCAGYRVGRYSSPAVFSEFERYQVNGRPISSDDFVRGIEAVRQAAEKLEEAGFAYPTPFEAETALAFWYFREKKCDIVILETGMGGLTDATNIVSTTVAAVLTSISRDHIGMLGNTLSEIAKQKAGIIKNNCYVIMGQQQPEVFEIMKSACQERQAILRTVDNEKTGKIRYGIEKQVFSYKNLSKLEITMAGLWQVENALLAVETVLALREAGFQISDAMLRKGLLTTRWKGRFCVLAKKPYFIIDGAHNEDAAQKLREAVTFYFTNKRIITIIGILKDKEYEKIVSLMAPLAAQIITITPPHNKRALPAYELAEAVRVVNPNVTAADSLQEAVEMSYLLAGKEDVILAFGSLSYLGELSKIVAHRDRIRRDTHGKPEKN